MIIGFDGATKTSNNDFVGVRRVSAPFWIFKSGAERVLVPFWIIGQGTTGNNAASIRTKVLVVEFRARLEIPLLMVLGVGPLIHLGLGCWVIAVTSSSYSTVTALIDTLTSYCGRGLWDTLTCCSTGFMTIFPLSMRSWILC